MVKTQDSFSGYLESRGKNTRLKLFNRRKALAEYGEISLEYVDLRKSDVIFEFINECHLVRFGKPAFSQLNIAMLRKVIDSLPESAHLKCSSLLKVNKSVVSAIVNVFLEGKIYNIQLGFLEDFDKRISLGTLHLGIPSRWHSNLKISSLLTYWLVKVNTQIISHTSRGRTRHWNPFNSKKTISTFNVYC